MKIGAVGLGVEGAHDDQRRRRRRVNCGVCVCRLGRQSGDAGLGPRSDNDDDGGDDDEEDEGMTKASIIYVVCECK